MRRSERFCLTLQAVRGTALVIDRLDFFAEVPMSMRAFSCVTLFVVCLAGLVGASGPSHAGPDVVYTDCDAVENWGAIDGIRAAQTIVLLDEIDLR